ncbi:hypothetical protein ACOBR2_00395 [Telmatobacter bradus]|uniref:hypothetical protein n=1 Tax=Telmatobacter bradus TaxID=474953 RepID=UPI003B42FE72
MLHTKTDCTLCPPTENHPYAPAAPRDWEAHPSWIAGMEALQSYGNWVSMVVLPVAFQWIEEHKTEVYASVPEELKDDVGVVLAAAFEQIKKLPLYQEEEKRTAAYKEAIANGTWDATKTNPIWTGIVKKVRSETQEAFAEQRSLLGSAS